MRHKTNVNSLEEFWMPFSDNRGFKEEPRLIVKSKGIELTDHKGGRVLDGSSGLFCCPAGHGRMEIIEAVYEAMQENTYVCPFGMGHPGSFELARRVTEFTPDPMNHVFFVNSGSEAVDTALKIAMAYHHAKNDRGRIRFVGRERAYHGVNMGGVSLSGMIKNRDIFSSTLPNVVLMRHTWTGEDLFCQGQPENGAELADDLARFCQTYGPSTIAAVFVEPVAGSTGTLVPPKGYLERLREICDEHGILLVFDEVITGFGRMGTNFAADKFGVVPDIMTMAKALTNGSIPMGAVAVKDEIYETITDHAPNGIIEFFHGYTYSAHPAAVAAGLAALDIYDNEGLFARANKLSDYYLSKVFSLKGHPLIKDIRGIGMMAGIELTADGTIGARGGQFQKKLFWNGLHVKFTGDSGIMAPAFITTEEQIDEMIDIFKNTLDECLEY